MNDDVIEVTVEEEIDVEDQETESWWSRHKDLIVPGLISGVFTVVCTGIKLAFDYKDNQDYIYTTDDQGTSWRLKGKKLPSIAAKKNRNVVEADD